MNRKKSKKLSISMKIIKKGDIVNLAEIFSREAKKSAEAGNRYIVRYEVEDHDEEITTDDDLTIFTSKDPLDLVKSKSITMTYYDIDKKQDIKVILTQGGKSNNNSGIQISGEKDWFTVIYDEFKIIIESIQPQTCFFWRHKIISVSLIALGFVISIWVVSWLIYLIDSDGNKLELLNHLRENPRSFRTAVLIFTKNNRLFVGFFTSFIFWLISLPIAKDITNWLLKMWPNIEFDFGPEHLKFEKSKRKRRFAFLTIVVVPVVIAVLSIIA